LNRTFRLVPADGGGLMIGGSSRGLFLFFNPIAGGGIAPPNTVRTRRFTIAIIAGPEKASGGIRSRRLEPLRGPGG